MSDSPDTTTWQQLGALLGTALAGLGIGRVSKREQTENIVVAIQAMEKTLDNRLNELHLDIKQLLGRGDPR